MASIMNEMMGLSFKDIVRDKQMKGTHPRTIEKSLKKVTEHRGDFYYNGKKGKCRRKQRLPTPDLELIELELQDPESDIVNGHAPLYNYYKSHVVCPIFLVFQQDNDPKHTLKRAKQFFRNEGIDVMEWVLKLSDVSPVENYWAHLKQEIRKHP
ncbi:hypothetical protein DFH08DRAFT_971181 [Mycena albidolilacea]|uniref:Uncharacterized protein n=1 Tax=Mycena albidolilacea TaxID=1033008 RepID=A0AAD6ZEK2_9AGAR|nr:hypothetical protein DFH08DRAFT_971181 [Mycena albidolilacea]